MTSLTSLRSRLTVWFTLLLAVVALVGGSAAYLLARQDPDSFLDDQLRQIALYAGDQASSADAMPGPSIDPSDIVVVQIWDAAGRLVRSTPPGVDLPRQTATGFSDPATGAEQWRTYSLVEPSRTVQVSQRAAVRDELALNAALAAILPSLLVIPVCWLLARSLIWRILRPLDDLAAELARRGPESVQALPAMGVPDEIAPLVTATNNALERLGQALRLQREFISNAAHQLRTPLTALRLQVQNLRRSSGDSEPQLLDDMELGLKRMSALTGQLLVLAREEALRTSQAATVSLPNVLNEVIAAALPLAQGKGIAIEAGTVPDIRIGVGREDALVLLSNILDNAARYTPPGGTVWVVVRQQNAIVVVEITDNGPGLPDDMLLRVFDRFVRYSEDSEGSGLGLAIAKAIADRVGARISLRNRDDRAGLIAVLAFPIGAHSAREAAHV